MAQDDDSVDLINRAGAAAFGVLASLAIWLAFGENPVTPYAWVVLAVALAAIMKYAPPRVADPVAAVCYPVGGAVLGVVVALLMLMPGAAAYTFSRFVVETFPRWLQLIILLGWFLLLAGVSVLLHSRALRHALRARFERRLPQALRELLWPERVETWAAIALYINFVVIAMGCFAGVAYLLHVLTPPLFLPGKTRVVEHGSLADFLLWHLLDAIPGLKVPETIKWDAPLAYERSGAGWLVLLFKVMVIVPVVSGIGRYLKEEEVSSLPPSSRGSIAPSE